tara:strand:- start:255 stop:512 length:258 start_codon:yes stop_codon:yes gene_type:complete
MMEFVIVVSGLSGQNVPQCLVERSLLERFYGCTILDRHVVPHFVEIRPHGVLLVFDAENGVEGVDHTIVLSKPEVVKGYVYGYQD